MGSWRSRKAWCGRLADFPSCVVRMTLRVSPAPSFTGLEDDSGFEGVNLPVFESVLVLRRENG